MKSLSIVIPCYNDVHYISACLESANQQGIDDLEIIVVDDGSDHNTKNRLNELRAKYNVLLTQENYGQSTARNEGIKVAKGEFILVLDSDDFFEPSFSSKALKILSNSEYTKIVTCHARRFIDGTEEYDIHMPHGGEVKDILFINGALGSVMFRKKDWELVRGYDENMKSGFEDWEFYIRLLKNGGEIHVIPEVLFNYRMKKESTSTRANKIKHELFYFIYEKHKELYLKHSDALIKYLLSRIEREEKEKLKNLNRIEFRIGKAILWPLRKLKRLFKL